jgi:glycosyltransferase involved in cell wall biosynthesis
MADEPIKARVLTSYYRPKPGGFCGRLFRAIEALLDAGHTVHYLSIMPFPIQHPHCVHHRFPWPPALTHGLLFWGVFHLVAPLMLLYLALRHKITHAFAFGHTYGFLLQPVRLVGRVPLVVFLRGDVMAHHHYDQRSWWITKLDGLLESAALHHTRVVCVSRTLALRVRQRLRWSRPLAIEVIPNHLPGHTQHGTAQVPARLPLRLVSVGILQEGKNPRLLIQMMATLNAKTARLTIFGIGPQAHELQQLARNQHVEDRIVFRGWSTNHEEIWRNADLLLFPSRHEGGPNTILEALASGVVVLASEIPEHSEILPPSSLLPIDSPKTWAEAVVRIAAEPDAALQRLRHEQQQTSRHLRFDWDVTVIEAILDSHTRSMTDCGSL